MTFSVSPRAAALRACVILLLTTGLASGHGGHDHGGEAGVVEHRCAHEEVVEPYHQELLANLSSVDPGAHRAVQAPKNVLWAPGQTEVLASDAKLDPSEPQVRASAQSNPRPIRISVDYQVDEAAFPEAMDHLQHRLIPHTLATLQGALMVKQPVEGRFKLPHTCLTASGFASCLSAAPITHCGSLAKHKMEYFGDYQECGENGRNCKYMRGGEGLDDTDFLLYVTANMTHHCTRGLLAFAGYCVLDPESNRPLAGFTNFCPNALITDAAAFQAQLETAIHETLHALVFSTTLFSKYVGQDGKPLGRSNVIKQSVEQGRNVRKVVTPTVVREARAHFGCNTLDGAEIENEGGAGIAGSHWESRLFQYEIMDGQAGNTMDFERHILSNLTLALAKDSGWYEPIWDAGKTLPMGRDAGCGFLKQRCTADSPILEQYYCKEKRDQCIWDRTAQGTCDEDYFLMDGCSYVRPYMNTVCTNASHLQPTAALWGQGYGPQSRCMEHDTEERFVRQGLGSLRPATLGCYHTSCNINGTAVYLKIYDRYIKCPIGGYVELKDLPDSGFLSGRIGPCPDPASLCPHLQCRNGCSSNGRCVDGVCECYLGFAGRDCSLDACTLESCDSPAHCDLESRTCVGGDEPDALPPRDPSEPSLLDKSGAELDGSAAWVQLETGEWVMAVTTGTATADPVAIETPNSQLIDAALATVGEGNIRASAGSKINIAMIVGVGVAVLVVGVAASALLLWRTASIRRRREEASRSANGSELPITRHKPSDDEESRNRTESRAGSSKRYAAPFSPAGSEGSPGGSDVVPAMYVANAGRADSPSPRPTTSHYTYDEDDVLSSQSRLSTLHDDPASSSGIFFLPTPPRPEEMLLHPPRPGLDTPASQRTANEMPCRVCVDTHRVTLTTPTQRHPSPPSLTTSADNVPLSLSRFSPLHATAKGANSSVVMTTPMSVTPPQPSTSISCATAPTDESPSTSSSFQRDYP